MSFMCVRVCLRKCECEFILVCDHVCLFICVSVHECVFACYIYVRNMYLWMTCAMVHVCSWVCKYEYVLVCVLYICLRVCFMNEDVHRLCYMLVRECRWMRVHLHMYLACSHICIYEWVLRLCFVLKFIIYIRMYEYALMCICMYVGTFEGALTCFTYKHTLSFCTCAFSYFTWQRATNNHLELIGWCWA